MPDSTLSAAIAQAAPVVVGGLLALAGGISAQVITHALARKRDRANFRRERLESLVKSVYRYRLWVSEKSSVMVFRNQDHDVPSPLDDAYAIQKLYFPELAQEMLAVEGAFLPILEFISAERLKHMKSQHEFISQFDSKPFQAAYKEHLAATNALVAKCHSLVPE